MSRPAADVRAASLDDIPALMQMWTELREVDRRMERVIPDPGDAALRTRLEAVTSDPAQQAFVALVDGEVAGMMLLVATDYAPLFGQTSVHAHYLHVRDGFRRRGVGKALLVAAVTYAEEVGAEHIMTSVPPQLRDTQRFYARLGFGPVVIRRSVPVSVLRRRLAPTGTATVTGNLLARRRRLRRTRAAVARVSD